MGIRRSTVFLLGFLCTSWSWASDRSQEELLIKTRIAQYLVASEDCRFSVVQRSAPDEQTVREMSRFDFADVERFLITRSVLAQRDCERNELGALAYTLLIMEGMPVSEETQEAISSVRTLAFDPQILVFEKEYRSLPSDLRASFEQLDYFKEPFDDVLLRQTQRASR